MFCTYYIVHAIVILLFKLVPMGSREILTSPFRKVAILYRQISFRYIYSMHSLFL